MDREMGYLQAGYGLNGEGYIVSDVSMDKIADAYFPCIHESVKSLLKLFPSQLHSVYVYGSVARGDAVVVMSDLDLLVIFKDTLSAEELAAVKTFASELSRKYDSLVREVGIAVGEYDYVVNPANYYEQAFLSELCVCVHGEDLRERFGPYRLTSEIAISFNGDIDQVLARTMKRLEAASIDECKTITQNFARKLIRTCYSMVMARSQIWTTRLHEQADVFIYHFPHKELMIRTLQKWIKMPPANQESVLELFKSEGMWVAENFEHEAQSKRMRPRSST
ncbi:nucleotidyltransferase domain-containing protein [Sporosarcina sp. ACRSL]|uniref:nucleotidyltransferase domain-containing protein n=1 Tax=Sporosarcina sp. ACRSL TaxID=2918215 RepID=UPI001EF42266|nr:nucleotidyltransferase domain-containing protein [Sporosarcina sp. ACRSL]MCG7344923.1 nucleotidyltransferase domain-containing protein [Sporosarcina sp. ACRSL]